MTQWFRYLSVMLMAACAGIAAAHADTKADVTGSIASGSVSGLPIPRFVSLKADKVNMHIGPAKNYEVKWLYQRAGPEPRGQHHCAGRHQARRRRLFHRD